MPGRLAARRPRPGNTRAAAAAAYRSSVAASSSVLPDELDRSSDAYACNAAAVGGLLSDLRSRVSQHVPKTNGDIPSFDEAFSDHRRLLDRLVLYVLVELKGNGDGNCQGSGGDVDGRQEVRGLDGGVVVDVFASLLLLYLWHPSTRRAGHLYMASSAL
ncbi:OVARIAN TUMOR DOMAIN-containing deubiquitinating enzyme 12 isoform X2 [Triticum aestivum]|uniref:OVARIAN TUMOR DOMAIN-containing deubiquitinating enzyme 12 isoform X2 n=1 Tax=Triticum aestivum TaxID=4565 RepID=UPI001D0044D6|nr:OVARIAN TUMOR DOMAIN-containing deubiquitinating enzyme 12-like isoform X2 [Triticum aestivum]